MFELQAFDTEIFLRDYWQQKPLLIKNPWREWSNPLDPDELAGLACEEGVESRLVLRQRKQWTVEHGPIAEDRFAKLPKTDWTLLVQAVDHYVPEVAELIEPFRFLPNWRIDDVMVSYAADQGGVGPHFDQYDVFLVQGLGRRRWRIGAECDHATPLLPHDELRLLAEFESTEEWILEPGDILYLPPRFAHDGVALGDDCMTYSIGFRAPARSELIASWCDHLLDHLTDDERYADPGIAASKNPGEISPAALTQLQRLAMEKLLDTDGFRSWFGRYTSTRKYPGQGYRPRQPFTAAAVTQRLGRGDTLLRDPGGRFVYLQDADGVQLFVDGEMFVCRDECAAFAQQLCAQPAVSVDADMLKSTSITELLTALANQGSLVFIDDD